MGDVVTMIYFSTVVSVFLYIVCHKSNSNYGVDCQHGLVRLPESEWVDCHYKQTRGTVSMQIL